MYTSNYNLGDIVYLKTDVDQYPRIVYELCFSENGVMYALACGTDLSRHYEVELSRHPVYTIQQGLN